MGDEHFPSQGALGIACLFALNARVLHAGMYHMSLACCPSWVDRKHPSGNQTVNTSSSWIPGELDRHHLSSPTHTISFGRIPRGWLLHDVCGSFCSCRCVLTTQPLTLRRPGLFLASICLSHHLRPSTHSKWELCVEAPLVPTLGATSVSCGSGVWQCAMGIRAGFT